MVMTKTMRINKWGNSLGIRFPSEFVNLIQLEEKALVEIQVDWQRLIITKIKEEAPRKTIQELFEMYPTDYIQDNEVDWGEPLGGEVW